jgi:hypothetical protein
VVSDLVGLVDGWSANVEASALGKQISARFDGVTVLKALQYLADSYGLHLRQSVGGKRLEFGAFGTDINLTLRNVEHTDISLQDNDDVALIESISVDEDAENVVNRIYPQGGGVGLASFDLAQSTRTGRTATRSRVKPVQTGARCIIWKRVSVRCVRRCGSTK